MHRGSYTMQGKRAQRVVRHGSDAAIVGPLTGGQMRPDAVKTWLDSAAVPDREADDDPSRLTDAELLAGCRRGDEPSWDVLVRRYESLVFTAARRAGLPREDAADVTQASFVALLDSIDTLRADERLGGWLMTVAHRQIWRTRRRLERQDPGVQLPTSTASIEEWDRVTAIHEALTQIGSPCRELLFALYLDPAHPTYGVVAARLGVAAGTVGPMRGRCLGKLRRLMEDR